jgi:secreted trypsin-like serine protease
VKENNINIAIGVASFIHIDGCATGHPAVYTDVSQYIDWINEKRRTWT